MSGFRSLALYFLSDTRFSFFLSLLLCDLLAFWGMDLWLFREIFIFIYEPKEMPLVMCYASYYFLLFSLHFPYVLLFMSVAHICMYILMQFLSYLSFVLFHFKVPFLNL